MQGSVFRFWGLGCRHLRRAVIQAAIDTFFTVIYILIRKGAKVHGGKVTSTGS